MDLIIVESPTKSKTIQKFLGGKYEVLASFGHVRDLPKSTLGIDLENNFTPKYVVSPKARKRITELKKKAKTADNIIISTDPDREGEAIAWHILEVLGLKENQYKRIAFHEITEEAIEEALKNPRFIDMNLVNSQQARRILDRIVGYKLSPLLWKKIAKGLSAGRVQSVALKIICQREDEIKKFVAQEYWTISAFLKNATQQTFEASLIKYNGQDANKDLLQKETAVQKILNELSDVTYKISKIEKKEIRKSPPAPFTTSTLQQDASNKFGFSAKITMSLAQELYEEGYITYHRTDSVNIAATAIENARMFIVKNYGESYLSARVRRYKNKSHLAQEAHEAIRPSHCENTPQSLAKKLNPRLWKLYDLIWKRFLATQAQEAILDVVRVDVTAGNCLFRANGQTLKFDGYLKINPLKLKELAIPELKEGENVFLDKLIPKLHFTDPPPRYTEATLIKKLEENGIGRPSTYAPIISLIQARHYVVKNKTRQFESTDIGEMVNKLLNENFPEIVDINFTAKMEEELDEIAENRKIWTDVLREFYTPFVKQLEQKYQSIKKEPAIQDQVTEKICPNCGGNIIIKFGRFGKFYACSKFPECKYTAPLESPKLDIKCPKCHTGDLIAKKTKKGKIFYACSRWPDCDFALWEKPINEFCPQCNSILSENAKGKIKCSNKNCKFIRTE